MVRRFRCGSANEYLTASFSTAMAHFRLKEDEMATLPYVEFTSNHPNATRLGKSYNHGELQKLVFRRFATLTGDETPDEKDIVAEREFLAKGKRLYENQ
jgi:hypothetical protein